MKKFIMALCLIVTTCSNMMFAAEADIYKYRRDQVYIKIKDTCPISDDKSVKLLSSSHSLGINDIDPALDKLGATIKFSFKSKSLFEKNYKNSILRSTDAPDLSKYLTVECDSASDLDYVIRTLEKCSEIEYAEKVPIHKLHAVPNDPFYKNDGFLHQIAADKAWDIFKAEDSDNTAIVGICDTGVNWFHPDLSANLLHNLGEDADGDGVVVVYNEELKQWEFDPDDINNIDDDNNGFIDDFTGWNFYNKSGKQDNITDDPNGHGTHVCGLAAGVTNNGIGISSVAWNVKYIVSSHASENSLNSVHNGFDGIIYLAERGADVINCSWGFDMASRSEAAAVKYASSLGAVIIASAGNDYRERTNYPASYPGVISVAALNSQSFKTKYSNYHISTDIAAPGGDFNNGGGLLSTYKDAYEFHQGTSMAAPIVAGAVAYLKSRFPNESNDEIINRMLGSCDNIDELNPAYAGKLGAGRLNLFKAVSSASTNKYNNLKPDVLHVNQVNDDDHDGAAEPGETISIGFSVRNYSHSVSSELCRFTLSCESDEIEIINSVVKTEIPKDAEFEVPANFTFKIKEGSSTGKHKFKLNIKGFDAPVVVGDEYEFDFAVAAGGILVWDGLSGQTGYSGKFISEFLESQGRNVVYYSDFPPSLFGFDAVFLSFGLNGSNFETTYLDKNMNDKLVDYLKQGGKLYIEGCEFMGNHKNEFEELLSLLGIEKIQRSMTSVYSDSLIGQDKSLASDLIYNHFSYANFGFVNLLTANKYGRAAFKQSNFGITAVQNTGEFGQKTFMNSYPIASILDKNYRHNNYELISRLLNFFEADDKYYKAYIGSDVTSGHAPLTVEFADSAYGNISPLSYIWDFDEDGSVDSDAKNPSFVFNTTGKHNIELKTESELSTTSFKKSIWVFNGESALNFESSTEYAYISPSESFNLKAPITIEAWIYPKQGGGNSMMTILDKSSFELYIENSNNLRLIYKTEFGGQADMETTPGSIRFNEWQHIAVCYDSKDSVTIYINGEKQLLDISRIAIGQLKDNSEKSMILGMNDNAKSDYFGKIDELRIWNKVLSEEEIKARMLTELSGTPSNLFAYWNFDEGNGKIAEDLSGNNNICSLRTKWCQGKNPGYIMSVPYDIRTCPGKDIIFPIETYKYSVLEYKWLKDGLPIENNEQYAGVDSDSLHIINCTYSHSADYQCEVSVLGTSIKQTTTKINLDVFPKSEVEIKGTDHIVVSESSNHEFNAEITGSPAESIHWYQNDTLNTKLSGLNPILTNLTKEDAGTYYCVVTNKCSVADTTQSVRLDVVPNSVNDRKHSEINLQCTPAVCKTKTQLSFNNLAGHEAIISIINMGGKTIKRMSLSNLVHGENRININLSDLDAGSGIYYVKLTSDCHTDACILMLIR